MVLNNFSKIKQVVNGVAFRYFIDQNELMSEMNLKLSNVLANDQFDGDHEKQFWAFIHLITKNCAFDYLRNKEEKKSRATSDIENVRQDYSTNSVHQSDFEIIDFSDEVVNNLKTLIKNPMHVKVFKNYFLKGLKYAEVAETVGISEGNVKTIIFKIRKLANEKFGTKYRELC